MLSVTPKPSNPNIINVSGVNMEFDVDKDGNIIGVTALDRGVNVWMTTGAYNGRWIDVANIQWGSAGEVIYVSRNNMNGYVTVDPQDGLVFSLYHVSGSMDGITVFSSVATFSLESSTSFYYNGVGRKGLAGDTSYDVSPTGTTPDLGDYFASVEDGKVFGLDSSGGNLLWKQYNFSSGTLSTLYTDAIDISESWEYQTVVGDRGSESLVAFSICGTGSTYDAYVRVFDPYDETLTTKTGINFAYDSHAGSTYGISGIDRDSSVPQIYENYVIYACREDWDHNPNIPWHAPDYFHWTDIIIYDVDGDSYSVGKVENDYDLFRDVIVVDTGMDYETGNYYFLEIQKEPTHLPSEAEEYRLYKVEPPDTTISLVKTIDKDDYVSFVQGKSNLYGVHFATGDIEKISSGATVGTGPTGTYFAKQFDDIDSRVWFGEMYSNMSGTLTGVSVIGDDDKIITINGNGYFVSTISTINIVTDGVVLISPTVVGLVEL